MPLGHAISTFAYDSVRGWLRQEVTAIIFTREILSVNAEDFKQGAKIDKASVGRAGAWALCLKFCCAKPLQHASSYVFWKVAVLERSPKKDRRWEGIEMGEARRMCFAMRESEENGISGVV